MKAKQLERRSNKPEAAKASTVVHSAQYGDTYLIRTDLNSEGSLVTTLVCGILAIVHLIITAPLKGVREGIEVVATSHVLVSGY